MDKLPVYSVELVKILDQLYPPKNPHISTPDRQIWFDSGRRDVVDFLLTHINSNEEQELPVLLTPKD